ncbi:MAG: EAL domain-containing protein [Pegethrix bostrychoides GSE-TBD4-15B]|jgi:diguanylate cyclase (GGDEF)-like protein|uniref:EAL domain-containing protein n=1 Tax=Pegethrix bostrychoides GSE-TBD4-15B TaxID=2839662 RepID=A0A951PE62_9CYAN|nr:EAL domain-containing protein [Pegethrix bostrychoides GSE-TBD4-15B]
MTNSVPEIVRLQAKVLIVEDELVVAENIARNLSKQGYIAVDIVDTGEDAVLQAKNTCPDIVLMDIMLQGELDGIDAAGIIRQELNLPVVYMTAYADDTTLERAKQTEPYGYLVKPFKPYDLRTTIEIALQKHRTDSAMQAEYLAQLAQAETKLTQLTHRDLLTQLPTWSVLQAAFEQRVEQMHGAVTFAESKNPPLIPVFCVGLDRFHRISNHWGYKVSDDLLQAITDRITACMGESGKLARTDMSEFALIMESVEHKSQAEIMAQALLKSIAAPFWVNDQEIFITASIGIALYGRDAEQADALLRRSRRIMHHTQQQGGNSYRFFSRLLRSDTIDRLVLESDLHHALERQELLLHYQPKVNLRNGKVTGAEALLRWQHPKQGMVSPAVFIPIAEESGLIEPIGEWVIQTACQQLRDWQLERVPPIKIAVNLSSCQFSQPQFHQRIRQILQQTQVNPIWLELELTESTLIQNVELTMHRLQMLKALGLQIAIDDFGTGYSSLSNLYRFPFDILKLDRSFVQDIHANPKNAAIATAIITMAHQLNLKVVAEGVETINELAFLFEKQCDEIQGFLFSKPLPPLEFAALLRSGKRMKSLPTRES